MSRMASRKKALTGKQGADVSGKLTRKGIVSLAGLALLITILDQLTKWIALTYLDPRSSVMIIPDVLWLTLTENTGAAFSILSGNTVLLAAISLLVVVGIGFVLVKGMVTTWTERWLLAVLAGGALGNLLDRLLRGAVVDFIDLGWWPIFNLADIAITLSIVVLLILEAKRAFLGKG